MERCNRSCSWSLEWASGDLLLDGRRPRDWIGRTTTTTTTTDLDCRLLLLTTRNSLMIIIAAKPFDYSNWLEAALDCNGQYVGAKPSKGVSFQVCVRRARRQHTHTQQLTQKTAAAAANAACSIFLRNK